MVWMVERMLGRGRAADPTDDRWGAIGAGLVLVLLPSAALFFGVDWLEEHGSIGLPLLAVFGIMVLVGALAMTSTLFTRLRLAAPSQPLALPPGSVRATMALALIVLFSIIAIAAMRPTQEVRRLEGVSGTLRAEMLRDPRITLVASTFERCVGVPAAPPPAPPPALPPAPPPGSVIALAPPPGALAAAPAPVAPSTALAAPCAAADERHSLVVKVGPDAAAQDLTKQLLLLIGQLMTMAVSFYFASRKADGSDTPHDATGGAAPPPSGTPGAAPRPSPAPAPDDTPGAVPAATPAVVPVAPPGASGTWAAGTVTASVPVAPGPGPHTGSTFDLGAAPAGAMPDAHEDCGAAGGVATADEDLPEAQGGVEKP